MNKEFVIKIASILDLGEVKESPVILTGGLTHYVYKLTTSKGTFVVKILNENIDEAKKQEIKNAESFENLLKQAQIPAIYALEFNGKKSHEVDGKTFYIFEWFDGRSLTQDEISIETCQKMGSLLARIHNIDLKQREISLEEIHIDFDYYLKAFKNKDDKIYQFLQENIELLKDTLVRGNAARKRFLNVVAICHNDMNTKNVMWHNDDFRVIDLESLSYGSPYLELFHLSLCWSGFEKEDIDLDKIRVFFQAYFKESHLDFDINWEDIYYSNLGRLAWLEFCLKKALREGTSIETLVNADRLFVYYDAIKNNVLEVITEVCRNYKLNRKL